MNTNLRTLHLGPGQALAPGRHGAATLFLAQGEVVLRTAPEWLGDQVFQAPDQRVAAPAVVALQGLQAITAVGNATLHGEPAPRLADQLATAWRALFQPARKPAGAGA